MRFTEFISEAGSPAQQAAIAIAMKKAGKKPKGVAEGAPELLKAEMPMVRHIENELATKGYKKGTEEYKKMFGHALAYYRKFGFPDYRKGVAENNTAAGINKMFNNLGDPVFSNLQRIALLAMQGRQQEASGRLQSVIKDASPTVQKKIIDAVNSIKPVTINGKIADSSTIDKSKQHRDWIINTFIPWVQSLLGQQGVAEGPSEVMGLASFALGGGIPGGESPSDIVEFAPYDHNDSDDDFDDEGDDELRSLYDTKFELEAELDYADEEDREHLESELEDVHARILELNPDATLEEGENWSKYNHKRVGGMSKKSVNSYRRSHPGSKIQTAVTTKPSKLKKGSKAAKRRASFCARMRGMKKHRTGAKTAHDPNSNINKSLRRWHCESIEELHELVMLAEQFVRNNKK
jgi:hypothetical protein